MHRKGRKTKRLVAGLSLVESIVSIFVVTLAVLTCASVAVLSKLVSVQAGVRNVATTVAQAKFESFKLSDFATLNVGTGGTFSVLPSASANLPIVDGHAVTLRGDYRVESGPSPNLRLVTVRVAWRSMAAFGGRDRAPLSEVSISGLVGEFAPDPTRT